MAQEYPKTWKNCGVCDFWGGTRNAHITGARVIVDHAHSKGTCLKGSFKGQSMQAKQ